MTYIERRRTKTYNAAGAIDPNYGTHGIKGTGALAMTLANPTPEMDGVEISIIALSGNAHTITITGGISGLGTGDDVGTLGGAVGDGMTLKALNKLWHLISNTNVTIA